MFTSTNRKTENEKIDYLPKNAYTAGLNFKHFWKNKAYMFAVRTVFSSVNGDTASILNMQESPVRYLQRPDAQNYLGVDSTKTSMQGHGGTIEFAKTGEGHWHYTAWVTWRSPGLELNDVGYLRSADEIQQVIWASYRIWEPFSIFRRLNINFNQWTGWDFGGRNTFWGLNTNLNTQFKNHWFAWGGLNYDGPSLSKSDLRGGPSLRFDAGWNYWAGFETDKRKKISFDLNGFQYQRFNGSANNWGINISAIYRPSDRVKISLGPFFDKNDYNLQYIETADFDGNDRVITGQIDQSTFGMTGRIDVSITPDFTIQYYGQPFMSNGDYTKLNRITDPQSDEYENRFHVFTDEEISYIAEDEVYVIDENQDGMIDYLVDNPNFEFLQFRSNLVVRWEYIPGSTVYLVWSQGRTDFDNQGEFIFGRNWDNLFSTHPHDVFLLKVSYRIGL